MPHTGMADIVFIFSDILTNRLWNVECRINFEKNHEIRQK